MHRLLLVLPLALCSTGCMTWWSGTIPPGKLAPELRATYVPRVKPLQLASLGRPVQAQYRIQPGDLLEVAVSDLFGENQTTPIPARVQEDGTVSLPLVGPVAVSSLTVPESEKVVFASYCAKEMLRRPQVMVNLKQSRQVRVNILGAVHKPGQYDLGASECDVLSALVAAGGLTNEAGTILEIHRRVIPEPNSAGNPDAAGFMPLVRDKTTPVYVGSLRIGRAKFQKEPSVPSRSLEEPPRFHYSDPAAPDGMMPGTGQYPRNVLARGPQVVRLNLNSEKDQELVSQGIGLQNGDTISVEERKIKPIYVVGMVNRPGDYPFPTDRELRVLEAIGLAGGVDRNSLPNRVIVIRQKPDELGLVAVRVDLDCAKKNLDDNIRLMPGDTVSVEESCMSYLRGLLRGALRFGVGASLDPAIFY